jgi:hypothetical protein
MAWIGPPSCVLDVLICSRPAGMVVGGSVFVARVVVSGSRRESWTVVGEDGQLVEPAERFLSFLTDAGRSPNTVKAYAHDLRDWFAFLAGRALDWAAVSVEDVAAFVAWLRLPPSARGAGGGGAAAGRALFGCDDQPQARGGRVDVPAREPVRACGARRVERVAPCGPAGRGLAGSCTT